MNFCIPLDQCEASTEHLHTPPSVDLAIELLDTRTYMGCTLYNHRVFQIEPGKKEQFPQCVLKQRSFFL